MQVWRSQSPVALLCHGGAEVLVVSGFGARFVSFNSFVIQEKRHAMACVNLSTSSTHPGNTKWAWKLTTNELHVAYKHYTSCVMGSCCQVQVSGAIAQRHWAQAPPERLRANRLEACGTASEDERRAPEGHFYSIRFIRFIFRFRIGELAK